jgi:hypothetical protein
MFLQLKKSIVSCGAIVPNKDSAEDKIHLLAEHVQGVHETNNSGPLQKHPDKILRPFSLSLRINFDKQPRKIGFRDE